MDDGSFGPALPPATTSDDKEDDEDVKRVKLSQKNKRKRRRSSSSSGSSDSSSDSSGSVSDDSDDSTHKPSNKKTSSDGARLYTVADKPPESSFIGPVMPPGFFKNKDGSSDEEDWGPSLPKDGESTIESTAIEIERRAARMRNKLLNPEDSAIPSKPQRENWMMELPPERNQNFGVTARKFSMAAPRNTGDRSGWTDTPADRAKKEQDLLAGKQPTSTNVTAETNRMAQKDKEYSRLVEEYNKSKKRSKSLLEMHTEQKTKEHKKKSKKDKHKEKKKKKKKEKDEEKEKKKEKKKEEKIPERRPFDRDVDLKANRLDNAQKQAIIKRSQQLTGRFGHGNSVGKFL